MSYPVMPLGFLGSQGDNDTYQIERSLRFNSADSAYLNRTPASAGNRKTWTWSGWIKRTKLDSSGWQEVFTSYDTSGNTNTDNGWFGMSFQADKIRVDGWGTNWRTTTQVFRDVSSWYHVVLVVDTTNATAGNRIRLYINGSEVTSFSTTNNPTQNFDTAVNATFEHNISSINYTGRIYYFNGYLTEINFIDGQALTPSSFGEADAITGRWKAKAFSGTYGTNGFYLKFADNSGTTSTTLGKDSSPNGNNWTPNNFSVTAGAGNDSLLDSPTNNGTSGNYATLNPLEARSNQIAPSNGNLDAVLASGSSAYFGAKGSFLITSGKWYWECTIQTISSGAGQWIGIGIVFDNVNWPAGNGLGSNSGGYEYLNDGVKWGNGVATAGYGASYTTNDVIGVAFDADSRTLEFYKNGVSQGVAFSNVGSGTSMPTVEIYRSTTSSQTVTINFGQRPFAYTAPTGFKALCTTNLPTPTIQKPSSYMDVVTYTGNGSTQTISSLGFSPDLVWLKRRNLADSHGLFDSVRGAGRRIQSNDTNAEVLRTDVFTSFDTNGFSITGSDTQSNASGSTYVAWAWDEAPIAGMDIVAYTGNGANRTIVHSLGVAPKMMIVKNRLYAGGWRVYHQSIGNTKNLRLNLTNAEAVDSTIWNNTSPTSSDFAIGTDADVNRNNDTHIAYLFAEVEGFSKFGSYTGNGSADGPFVFTGHRPRYLLIKRTDSTGNWIILDSARSTFNSNDINLFADLSNAESNPASAPIDFNSNGFKLRNSGAGYNASGGTYVYAAFAESPFKYARAR